MAQFTVAAKVNYGGVVIEVLKPAAVAQGQGDRGGAANGGEYGMMVEEAPS